MSSFDGAGLVCDLAFLICSLPPERLDYMHEECQTSSVKGIAFLNLKAFIKKSIELWHFF